LEVPTADEAMPKSSKITPRDVDKKKGTDPEFLLCPQSRAANGKVLKNAKNE
jgi:hypothetical protein